MRTPVAAYIALALSVVACSGQAPTPVLTDEVGEFNGARVELVEEGGIAGLSSTRIARYDDSFFSYVQRRICQPSSCGSPLDTASGKLGELSRDSLFRLVVAQSPLNLQNDYGTTKGAADMIGYTMTVTVGLGTKTIRADDGTMPPPMRRIVEAVHATISAARK